MITQLKRVGWIMAPLFLVATIAVIFFNRLLLSNLLLARGDPFLYFYPYWEMAAEAVRSGRIPLWNPNIFMGAPLLANSQVGLFYPLNWLVWFLFSTPNAYNASVFIHVMVGSIGAYFAARQGLNLTRPAALLAALLFGLGGYFTAQVEHINQLQGMAWLPWFLVALSMWDSKEVDWRSTLKLTVAMAALITLQFLAGHMQAVLISTVFVFVWLMVQFVAGIRQPVQESSLKQARVKYLIEAFIARFAPLFASMILSGMIAAVQLIPTIELIQHSSRQGGLSPNEALSFSLHPLLLSRALLPNHDGPLFIEYVTVLPLTALLLSVIGVWFGKKRLVVISLLIIAALGLFMALGIFNPVNQIVVRIPGFNLFRVPARWLVLYAMAMALLAGVGLDELMAQWWQDRSVADGTINRPLIAGILIIAVLIIWAFVSVPLAGFIPIGAEATAVWPSGKSLFAWLAELLLAILLIIFATKSARLRGVIGLGLVLMAVLALFAGTRNLPYNNPTTPEAYFDPRPPSLRLQTDEICAVDSDNCGSIPGRLLSLSNIFFDVGDQPEIDTIYSDLLTKTAQYDYTVAIKHKEIIAPNLPMIYDLSSVDGFDGGILPMQTYNDVTSLMLPEGVISSDGRLREHLSSVPDERWLDLFNAEYVITDKVGDVWQKDVFFDLQFPTIISDETGSVGIGYVQPFEATELWLLVEGDPGSVDMSFQDGDSRELEYLWAEENRLRVVWTDPGVPEEITLNPCGSVIDFAADCNDPWQLLALALVDTRDGTFQPLVAGDYRLIHSGDVKIYQNLDVLPRAFLLNEWDYSGSTNETIEIMGDPHFDPRRLAILQGEGPKVSAEKGVGEARIITYEPERVVIGVESDQDSLLILTDSHYPGWKATIDGTSTSIYEADILFRGVVIPAGEHIVEFTFEPETYMIGRIISLAGLCLWLILVLAAFWPKQLPWESTI